LTLIFLTPFFLPPAEFMAGAQLDRERDYAERNAEP
jgi:hypothetical protein